MGERRLMRRAPAAAVVAAALVASGAPAAAEPVGLGSRAATTASAHGTWNLDEPGTPATAIDSSGFGNHGTNQHITGTGTGYQFDGTSSRVVVPDSSSLDPGTANFSFGVTLVMTAPPARGETFDILRKGLSSTSGGEYKLEIENVKGTARARCLVKGTARTPVAVVAPTNLANGRLHTITCSKSATGVSVQVDSLNPLTKRAATIGSVSNSSSLGLGAKAERSARTGFDWYRGLINEAWVRVG